MQRGDWCSEIAIRYVARECHLDASTVTRAYQLLAKLGCLRRTDPGRDPSNPFQQATAITEIRIPTELLKQLDRHPSRGTKNTQGRGGKRCSAATPTTQISEPNADPDTSSPTVSSDSTDTRLGNDLSDPFPDLTGRARAAAISELIAPMSPTERHAYQEAIRMHHPHMEFDSSSNLLPEAQTKILQLLASLSRTSTTAATTGSGGSTGLTASLDSTPPGITPSASRIPVPARRKLTLFELSSLHRDLQSVTSATNAPELLRQVVWSIEAGALRRFETRHALHIALKKVREGLWTRPHRMPPNWARALSQPPAPEPCGHA
jgi:hypothetical protein